MKQKKLERNVRQIIEAIDDNPSREGLRDTPKRYLKFLREFISPLDFNFTVFDAEGYDQMIIQSNIPFYSLCEHHMAPFFGVAAVAYIPDKHIVGLSKLARVVDMYSRRLQNQERITQQVADFIFCNLFPKGCAVNIKAQHLCMAMRGVEKHDTWTTTTALKGCFKTDLECKNEFFNFIKQ